MSDALLDQSVAWLRPRRAEMTAMLRDLVTVNSHTANVSGVGEVCERLRASLTSLGLRCQTRSGNGCAAHLRAFTDRARTGQRNVLLVGHMDTVFPPGTFEGYREDEQYAHGPGVLDMKGGLVIMFFALSALGAVGALERVPVELFAVSDEETGSFDGARFLAEAAPRAAVGLVFESGREGDVIITRRKGTGAVTATAMGRAAHAGNLHHEGINAIWALAQFVDRAQRLTDYSRGVTVNVGRIEGGISKNTVPDQARAQVDFRFVQPGEGELLIDDLRRVAREAATAVPGSSISIEGAVARAPLAPDTRARSLYEEVASCQREAGLGSGEAPLLGGGSDANTLSSLGVPAVDGLGPRGSGFHTTKERIELASLVPKAESLVRFLLRRAE